MEFAETKDLLETRSRVWHKCDSKWGKAQPLLLTCNNNVRVSFQPAHIDWHVFRFRLLCTCYIWIQFQSFIYSSAPADETISPQTRLMQKSITNFSLLSDNSICIQTKYNFARIARQTQASGLLVERKSEFCSEGAYARDKPSLKPEPQKPTGRLLSTGRSTT